MVRIMADLLQSFHYGVQLGNYLRQCGGSGQRLQAVYVLGLGRDGVQILLDRRQRPIQVGLACHNGWDGGFGHAEV
jgi:hypothetical protein